MRRSLLGLAALALEGLEEDRLLAEEVGALDRPDRHVEVPARAERVHAEVPGVGGRAHARLEDPDGGGSVGPHRDDRLAGPDRVSRDREPLDDGVGVPLHEDPVGHRRRVRSVAIRDDDPGSRLGRARGAPLVGRGIAGPAATAQPGGADGGGRSGRAEVAHRDPQPGERPGGHGRVEVGGIRQRPCAGRRIEGQPFGVESIVASVMRRRPVGRVSEDPRLARNAWSAGRRSAIAAAWTAMPGGSNRRWP